MAVRRRFGAGRGVQGVQAVQHLNAAPDRVDRVPFFLISGATIGMMPGHSVQQSHGSETMKTRKSRRKSARRKAKIKNKVWKVKRRTAGLLKKKKNRRLA